MAAWSSTIRYWRCIQLSKSAAPWMSIAALMMTNKHQVALQIQNVADPRCSSCTVERGESVTGLRQCSAGSTLALHLTTIQ
eukprot:COSAG05_NODE_3609_length_1962_cov_17.736447_1_plen_80_part_10